MPREDSPCIVGDYWLDKRRDGKSPVWQIAYYHAASRQVRYSSTHKRDLDDAKAVIHSFVERERAKKPQAAEDARVIPLLVTYWTEKGKDNINASQTATSIRLFIGFLMQDEIGPNAVVTDMTPVMFDRFRRWRMAPHSCVVPWQDCEVPYSSAGVVGATIDRNLNDIRAGINHAEANMRIPYAPKVPTLDSRFKSEPRNRLLSFEELGQIAWYSYHSPDLFRFFALLLGTGQRPNAANKFKPSQFDPRFNLIDMQPEASPQTKKRNAIIPAIRPLRPILKAWESQPVKSRKTAWRIMRKALGLSGDVVPYAVRHTVATLLYNDPTVPERQVSELLGHAGNLHRTTKRYAKYSPGHLKEAEQALSRIWLRVSREARKVAAVQMLSKAPWHGKITIAEKTPK